MNSLGKPQLAWYILFFAYFWIWYASVLFRSLTFVFRMMLRWSLKFSLLCFDTGTLLHRTWEVFAPFYLLDGAVQCCRWGAVRRMERPVKALTVWFVLKTAGRGSSQGAEGVQVNQPWHQVINCFPLLRCSIILYPEQFGQSAFMVRGSPIHGHPNEGKLLLLKLYLLGNSRS